ncbi:FAD-dependent pyridine nucleotide-disulfide oxidoreductase [Penicillium verhagenii]|uniref:FAD-dependent pyridine nucleotide-disulfide oxidoreductase n=1 Tax=Penicillium verhagenii TaxID=1562060 RepID=UPI0025459151|nr:FAD-dependent pyridine nucleotide-disulfide oxidoreductase [Penicillium verhagenii]KAJ5917650.1 FAD-dependent pyridine nucleotide-disulfide oxidoreductase [Penicillium verhagenii]
MRSQKVAIIGAGPSGLVTAKTLLHNFPPGTFSPVIFDGRHEVGGLWPNSPSSAGTLDPTMRTNLSRFTVAFSDLSWETAMGSSDVPMFPQARQVGQYLAAYTEKYIPRDVLRLGHRVLRAERITTDSAPQWRVHWRKESANILHDEIDSEEFDFLVVASGYFARQHIPSIPGLEELKLAGRVVHSSDLQKAQGILQRDGNILVQGNVAIVGGSMSGAEAASAVALHQSSWALSNTSPDKKGQMVHHIHSRPFWTLPTHLPHENPEESTISFLPLDLSMYDLGRRPPGPIEYALGVIPEEKAAKTNDHFSSLLGAEYERFGRMQGPSPDPRPPWVAIGNSYAEFVRSGAIEATMGRVVSVNYNPDTKLATVETISANGQSKRLDNIAAVVMATGFTPFESLSILPADVLSALEYSTEDPFLPLVLDKGGTTRSEIPDLGFVGFYRGPYWGVMEMQARFLGAEWIKEKQMPLRTDAQRESLRVLRDPLANSQRGQFPMGDYVGLMESFTKDLGINRTTLSKNDGRSGPAIPARYPYNHPSVTPQETMEKENDRTLCAWEVFSHSSHNRSLEAAASLAISRALQGSWCLSRERTTGAMKGSGTITFSPQYPSNPAYDREYVCDEYVDSSPTDKTPSSPGHSRIRSIWRLSESGLSNGQIEIWQGGIPVDETGGYPERLELTPFHYRQDLGKSVPGEYVIYAGGSPGSLTDGPPKKHKYAFYFKGVSIDYWERLEPDSEDERRSAQTQTVFKR